MIVNSHTKSHSMMMYKVACLIKRRKEEIEEKRVRNQSKKSSKLYDFFGGEEDVTPRVVLSISDGLMNSSPSTKAAKLPSAQ